MWLSFLSSNSYQRTLLILSRPTLLPSLFTHHLQPVINQPVEWSHPWFDRESYQSSRPVCLIIISNFHIDNSFLTSFHEFINNFSWICLLFSWLLSNQLSGVIPDSIGNLVTLDLLYVPLSFSSFTSTFFPRPSSQFCHFTNVISSYLNDNELSGIIPDSICNLIQTTEISLEGNHFSCPYPECCGCNLWSACLPWLKLNCRLDRMCPRIDIMGEVRRSAIEWLKCSTVNYPPKGVLRTTSLTPLVEN